MYNLICNCHSNLFDNYSKIASVAEGVSFSNETINGIQYSHKRMVSDTFLMILKRFILLFTLHLQPSLSQSKTKDNVTVDIDTSLVFRVMGEISQEEDPYNVYKFIHFVTAEGLQQQLIDAQVRFLIFILLLKKSLNKNM
jgi:hypothetical protein